MRMHLKVLGVLPCTFTHFPFICAYSHNIKSHMLYLHLLNLYLKYLWKVIMNAQLQFGLSIFFFRNRFHDLQSFNAQNLIHIHDVSNVFSYDWKFIIVVCIYRCICLSIFFFLYQMCVNHSKNWWVFWC
jgi:hypothetical protein